MVIIFSIGSVSGKTFMYQKINYETMSEIQPSSNKSDEIRSVVKFIYSDMATKIWKSLPL
jgi:hypothetical protein